MASTRQISSIASYWGASSGWGIGPRGAWIRVCTVTGETASGRGGATGTSSQKWAVSNWGPR